MPDTPSSRTTELRRLLIDQIQDYAVILLDADGTIVEWLSSAERIFGHNAQEAVGQPMSMLFTPEDIEKGAPAYELASATKKGSADDDRWMLRKDGMRFWATGTLSSLLSSDGKIRGFAKILRNRTDLKGQLETLAQRVAALEGADERKNTFIATMSHELRNPLSSLVAAFELLKVSVPQNENAAFACSTIQRQIDAMRRLIDDLLDMARIRVGKVELKKQRIRLQDILHAAIETCQPLLGSTHELKLILTDAPVTIDADADRLQQVLVNLLQNAVKYTEYGGQIFVKLYVEGKFAIMKVEDTGVGISAELLPRIFDLFTQAEFASDRGGLGIGLSVVKDLVTLHGGNVQVRSDGIGKGSTFTIRLPLAGDDKKRPDAPSVVT